MAARPSTAQRPRESIYHSGVIPRDQGLMCSPHLPGCVSALEDCLAQLHNVSLHTDDAIRDLPRLAGVLATERMSVMVNEPIIELYKAQMAEEIEPQIFEMVQRAATGLTALERKERTLKAKVEAAQSRAKAAQPARGTATGAVSSKLEARRIATVAKQLAQAEKDMQSLAAEIQQLEQQMAQKH
ncbi:hypothetical protein EXIGLDRAFT_19105 [Exidia glandulosa HHB12029]|uniref:DASH complex subunit SPC19 n=1 Tax=Exidia glandulosa HHB12029 TaxID=1314781 RepID=A0A166BUN1_EXIGL|nr:hypothetical protein EXIGLDRAFT_19105 [Exidia glandulosa HHB12029]